MRGLQLGCGSWPGLRRCRRWVPPCLPDRLEPPLPPSHYLTRSTHHFQSADALSVVELAPGTAGAPTGGLLAATFDQEGVAAWLLEPAGALRERRSGHTQVGAAGAGAGLVPAACRRRAAACGRLLSCASDPRAPLPLAPAPGCRRARCALAASSRRARYIPWRSRPAGAGWPPAERAACCACTKSRWARRRGE